MYQFFLIAAVTLVASFIQSVAGFGFGIFAMIFLPHLLVYTEANVLSTMLSLSTSVTVAASLWKRIDLKKILFPILGFLLSVFLSVRFIGAQSGDTVKLLLGIALLGLSVFFLFFSGKIRFKPTWYKGLLAGVLSGITGGMFSMSGPPVVVYFMQSEDEPDDYLATVSSYFLVADVIAIATKAAAGFVTVNVWIGLLFGAVGMAVGSFVGKKTRKAIKPQTVKKVVYAVMAASGVINIITALIS